VADDPAALAPEDEPGQHSPAPGAHDDESPVPVAGVLEDALPRHSSREGGLHVADARFFKGCGQSGKLAASLRLMARLPPFDDVKQGHGAPLGLG
jgi:hypothetical protein